MAHRYPTGTLLLIGAVFLSLNVLAVSARPGEMQNAEKTTTATAAVPLTIASLPAEPAGGPASIPVPPPTLNPVLITSGRIVVMAPDLYLYRDDPAVGPGQGIIAPGVSASGIQGPTPGPGIYPPSAAPGVTPSASPGPIQPPAGPTPIPPITPSPGRMSPGPTPPYTVAPVHEGL